MSEISGIQEIPRRIPVLNKETAVPFSDPLIEREWKFATEATRRDLIDKPEVRNLLVGFCIVPVSERLPHDFMVALAAKDKRIADLVSRYKEGLTAYLALPAVPDEQIKPDLRNARGLKKPKEVADMLRQLHGDEYYATAMQSYIESGAFLNGITAEEASLVFNRYSFARDVKLLALGAEILQQGNLTTDENGQIELPSGIRIGMNTSLGEEREDLLNPHLWERRRQIKDRIYEIFVGGRKYILKEKKTARHRDTKKHGHREGLTSQEEVSVAGHFGERGKSQKGLVLLEWEKPIGFVTYPDGFQFAVFEYEEGLVDDHNVTLQLASVIMAHREQFDAEFRQTAALAKKYMDYPEVIPTHERQSRSRMSAILARLGIKKEAPLEFTYEDFAQVKAARMHEQARELMKESLLKNGYENSDMDGYAYKIYAREKVGLSIFGFDFEYFKKALPEDLERYWEVRKEMNEIHYKEGLNFLYWNNGRSVTSMQKAAYFAILEAEGLLNPE